MILPLLIADWCRGVNLLKEALEIGTGEVRTSDENLTLEKPSETNTVEFPVCGMDVVALKNWMK